MGRWISLLPQQPKLVLQEVPAIKLGGVERGKIEKARQGLRSLAVVSVFVKITVDQKCTTTGSSKILYPLHYTAFSFSISMLSLGNPK